MVRLLFLVFLLSCCSVNAKTGLNAIEDYLLSTVIGDWLTNTPCGHLLENRENKSVLIDNYNTLPYPIMINFGELTNCDAASKITRHGDIDIINGNDSNVEVKLGFLYPETDFKFEDVTLDSVDPNTKETTDNFHMDIGQVMGSISGSIDIKVTFYIFDDVQNPCSVNINIKSTTSPIKLSSSKMDLNELEKGINGKKINFIQQFIDLDSLLSQLKYAIGDGRPIVNCSATGEVEYN